MKTLMTVVMIIIMMSFMSIAQSADVVAGKNKSASCAGCHGANGVSTNSTIPNLAGQKEAYLLKSIKAYRDGQRKDPMMSSMVMGLSDTDAADLAAYYASIK